MDSLTRKFWLTELLTFSTVGHYFPSELQDRLANGCAS